MKNFLSALFVGGGTAVAVAERPQPVKQPKFKSIVEEIHHSFNNEIDNILAEANISKSLETINAELKNKATALQSLGFFNTQEVKDIQEQIKKNKEAQEINKAKQQIIQDIKYFQDKYPHYRIITKEAIDRICNKYGLAYAAVRFYTGTVPQKNLNDLMNFKIDNKDKARIYKSEHRGLDDTYARMEYCAQTEDSTHIIAPLIIAAPPKDFDTTGALTFRDGKLQSRQQVEDPIVMQPVAITEPTTINSWYNRHREYFLIITAWGDEASDTEVIHAKMN